MSHAAAERGREIAVRMALGAAPRTIFGEFFAEVGWMAAGLVAGLAMALVATRALIRVLYQVAPLDPVSIAATESAAKEPPEAGRAAGVVL